VESGILADMLDQPSLPGHIYLHVPFCRSKCAYCDFASVEAPSSRLTIAVFRALEAEVRQWGRASLPGVVETVYVGGGTPSLYADQVARLLRRVSMELPLRDGVEVTVEANPDSIDETGLSRIVGAGANRISVGVQTLDDAELQLLGRVHSAWQAREALRIARGLFSEVSADLICGIPGQTLDSWLTTVAEVAASGVTHVSVYPLVVEEGTRLERLVSDGRLREPDPDVQAEMMLAAEGILERAGLARYEVANYARPGSESQHNIGYWTGHQYAGIGPGAHSMYTAATARALGVLAPDGEQAIEPGSRVRTWCASGPEAWLAGEGFSSEVLTSEEAAREDVMLGMRLARGVTTADVERNGLQGVFEALTSEGLVVRDGTGRSARWRTTTQGWLLGNEVFGRVWNGEDEGC
jgi:putative oxygen-independent coproporphyrinogen III oxidase